jgi:glycosyltransferase involved in cell wall biosynthesis
MTILIISSSYPALYRESFAGAFIEALAEALVQQGCRVHIVTQCTGAAVYRNPPEIAVHRFAWRGRSKPLASLSLGRDAISMLSYYRSGCSALHQLVTSVSIDVTLCAWTLPSGLFGWYLKRRHGIPYLTWSLGSDIWQYAHNPITRRLLQLILDDSLKNYADGYDLIEQIDAISSTGASFLSTTRILPPADHTQVTVAEGKTNFLFVGRYHPNKGPDLLLDAIRLLNDSTQYQTAFHFFGTGNMQAHLQSQVQATGLQPHVTISGPISAAVLSAYLEAVDYVVIPSRIDSIPVILSDALQKQCPVIVTDVGDMGRVVSEHRAGYVVAPEDPIALAQIIEQAYVQRDRHEPGMKALYRMFNVEENANRLLRDIRAVVGQKPKKIGQTHEPALP